jgi:hypothetical protein
MGVDYLQCDGCDIGYRDDSDYCVSCDCRASFCRLGCGKLKNYYDPFLPEEITGKETEIDENDPRWDDWDDGNFAIDKKKPITCVVCRKEKENDQVLLAALLKHYKITRKDAIKIWRKQ